MALDGADKNFMLITDEKRVHSPLLSAAAGQSLEK